MRACILIIYLYTRAAIYIGFNVVIEWNTRGPSPSSNPNARFNFINTSVAQWKNAGRVFDVSPGSNPNARYTFFSRRRIPPSSCRYSIDLDK